MMKPSPFFTINNSTKQSGIKAAKKPQMLSRQIESLRIVMRRMKVNQSTSLDSLINQKLKGLQ